MSALVLALNPSIDAEWRVADVLWEEKNNFQSERRWAGGKGINVARWLKHLGDDPQLLLPLGGKTGAELAGCLRGEKIPARVIRLCEPTRVNVIVTTNAGRQMRFNAPSPFVTAVEWGKLFQATRRLAAKAGLLILSGSLPRSLPDNTYALLIRLARRFGVRTLLDCDGPAFAAALRSRPFLVKPNEHELAQWWRRPLRSEREIIRAARAVSGQTRGWVLVSRGAKRSLLINQEIGFQFAVMPPRVKPRNTVGAGDALLAAVAQQIQQGCEPEQWLREAVAIGTAATQCQPGQLPALEPRRGRPGSP